MMTRIFILKVKRRVRLQLEMIFLRPKMVSLQLRNIFSRSSLLSPGGPVVSTTSYGKRIATAFYSIESVGRGEARPSRLVLWLDNPQALSTIPASLRRLEKRGLEIQLAENFGPHTKYYPYLEESEEFLLPLVTADDDMIYPKWWLERLVASYVIEPDAIHCYRARFVTTCNGAFTPYASWPISNVQGPTVHNFLTSVSGVLHPPAFLRVLRARGRAFIAVTPKNDDVWVHQTAVSHDYGIRQVFHNGRHFHSIPGTQETALALTNVIEGYNDVQIAVTYSAQDIAKLASN